MLNLKDVSLVAIDSAYHGHTEDAVRRCMATVRFGDVLLFADRELDLPAPTIIVPVASNRDAQQFMWLGVQPYLKTSHALYIQWDSWVVAPELWQDEFMELDWLGARWRHHSSHQVGNGGFSLRSKRLLDALVESKERLPFSVPEDQAICRTHRPYLEEQFGLRWGTEAQALEFSNEHDEALPLGFGFHGVWNFVLALSEEECIEKFQAMTPSQFNLSARYHALTRANRYKKLKVASYVAGLGA